MSENTIAQRIKILSETLEEKSAAFLKATGLTYQNLHDLTSGRKGGPSYPTTMKILSAYPQISERWFLFGEGKMLKTDKPQTLEDTGTKIPVVSATSKPRGAGTPGIPAELTAADAEPGLDFPMRAFNMERQKRGLPEVPHNLPGLDLLQIVANHTKDIENLREELRLLSEQVTKN